MQPTLIVTRTLNNRGGQVVLSHLIRELTRQGVALDFVAFKPQGSEDFPDCKPLYEGIKTEIISVPASNDEAAQMKEYIDAATKVLKERQSSYHTIVLDSWFNALAGIMADVDYQKTYHLVQSNPEFTPNDSSEMWKARAFQLAPHYPMQRIMVSKSLQTLFKERYDQHFPHIDLYIHDEYRKAEFEVIERPVLKFVSSASDFNLPSKGLDILLNTLDKFTDQPFELTLVSGKPIAKTLIGAHAFPIHTAFAATPAEMIYILQQHDLYICTSTRETFCLALAEPIMLGMPAIALDSVGNRDYANGDNFIFVKDKSQLLGKLQRAATLEVRRQLHAQAKVSMAQYTLEEMARQFRGITGI